jgi:hypothetical protein
MPCGHLSDPTVANSLTAQILGHLRATLFTPPLVLVARLLSHVGCLTLRISRCAPCAQSAACACSADRRQARPTGFSGGNLHSRVKVDLS